MRRRASSPAIPRPSSRRSCSAGSQSTSDDDVAQLGQTALDELDGLDGDGGSARRASVLEPRAGSPAGRADGRSPRDDEADPGPRTRSGRGPPGRRSRRDAAPHRRTRRGSRHGPESRGGDVPCHRVRVDDQRTLRSERPRHRRLAAADRSGQAHDDRRRHGACSSSSSHASSAAASAASTSASSLVMRRSSTKFAVTARASELQLELRLAKPEPAQLTVDRVAPLAVRILGQLRRPGLRRGRDGHRRVARSRARRRSSVTARP